jgi:hypothetical protein
MPQALNTHVCFDKTRFGPVCDVLLLLPLLPLLLQVTSFSQGGAAVLPLHLVNQSQLRDHFSVCECTLRWCRVQGLSGMCSRGARAHTHTHTHTHYSVRRHPYGGTVCHCCCGGCRGHRGTRHDQRVHDQRRRMRRVGVGLRLPRCSCLALNCPPHPRVGIMDAPFRGHNGVLAHPHFK